jgi:hypothetical protein
MAKFDEVAITWNDFNDAYGNLSIWPEEYQVDAKRTLVDFTKDRLMRNSKEQ